MIDNYWSMNREDNSVRTKDAPNFYLLLCKLGNIHNTSVDIGDTSGVYKAKRSINCDDYNFIVMHAADWSHIAFGC